MPPPVRRLPSNLLLPPPVHRLPSNLPRLQRQRLLQILPPLLNPELLHIVCLLPPLACLADQSLTGGTPFLSGKKYYKAVAGDTCIVIANTLGTFTVSDFQTWNPAVGSECRQLFLGYYYCVAVPGTPTTPKEGTATGKDQGGAAAAGPQPQQPGIVKNCKQFYQVQSGDGCYVIGQKYGISQAQFLLWNSGVKSDCSNVFLGYYVCVGV